MFFITLKRIIKTGVNNFWRNGWLSFATTIVMVLALFIMSTILTLDLVANEALKNVQEKVDISVYFNQDTTQEDILAVKKDIEGLSAVKSVDYVSRDEAWQKFQDRHKDNKAIDASIKELNENPLYATLNVKTKTLDQYPEVVNLLNQDNYKNKIYKINYEENKPQIEKLSGIVKTIRDGGMVITLIFLVVSILITFNTIRLTIYSYHQEIEIMRLVGASNWYIRAPFVVEGIIYGFIGCIAALLVFYPIIYYASGRINGFLPNINIFNYFTTNFTTIVSFQLFAGMAVGIISSLIAIRRYLKV